ncbi:MAG TPA: hypothetical protein VHY84_27290 [Bryobacteraceae bacterium]|jgi:hypothetical protein|nr:hypothetical protein [Bryobacteraceae bacterium]
MIVIAYKNPQAETPTACHAGLGVTAANAVEMLIENGIAAEIAAVTDGYLLRSKLRANTWPAITHLVLCAPFFDTPFLESLCREFPRIEFACVFHSNVGFLGVDNWSTQVLGEQIALESRIRNFRVAANSAKFCAAVNRAHQAPCALLPNLYFLPGPIERVRAPWTPADGVLRIGSFGATRILKNLPTAAWAAKILGNDLGCAVEFWVSGGREEGSGATSVIANARKLFAGSASIRLIEAPWAPWLDFRRNVVRKMHLHLQASFTESFNGCVADSIAEGIPSVVSPAIDWVPDSWRANPDDAVEIAQVGRSLLRDKRAPRDGYNALSGHNREAIASWKEFLA